MKKLIAILILFISFISIAQDKLDTNTGLSWADSLWGVSDTLFVVDSVFRTTDTVVVRDTVVGHNTSYLNLNKNFDWMNITAIDTGATYDDSCVVEYGVYIVEPNSSSPSSITITDTIWQRVQFMRDSSWTNTNLIVDDASVKSYQVFVGDYDLIRVRMTNVQAVNNRIFKFYATLSRKR